MSVFNKVTIFVIACTLSFLGGHLTRPTPQKEIVEVVKTQERERVVTKIKEQPDGSKETTIIETRDKTTASNRQETESSSKWSIWAASGARIDSWPNPVFTYGIDRSLFLGLSLGLYGRTDGEIGASLRFSF